MYLFLYSSSCSLRQKCKRKGTYYYLLYYQEQLKQQIFYSKYLVRGTRNEALNIKTLELHSVTKVSRQRLIIIIIITSVIELLLIYLNQIVSQCAKDHQRMNNVVFNRKTTTLLLFYSCTLHSIALCICVYRANPPRLLYVYMNNILALSNCIFVFYIVLCHQYKHKSTHHCSI